MEYCGLQYEYVGYVSGYYVHATEVFLAGLVRYRAKFLFGINKLQHPNIQAIGVKHCLSPFAVAKVTRAGREYFCAAE